MATLTAHPPLLAPRDQTETERTAPARPASGPVFIHDTIIPGGHSTLLQQLWRRWDRAADD